MSCVTPRLYNGLAMYPYQQHPQLQQHPHLLARPLLLCHRLPVGQFGALTSRPGDPYQRLADAQPPRNPAKPLTPFSIADILRDGQPTSPSPPAVVRGRQVRAGRSPDSTLRPRRPRSAISRPWNDDERPRRYSTDEEDDDCNDILDDDEEIEVDVEDSARPTSSTTTSNRHHITTSQTSTTVCPLDALLRMTSQPFDSSCSPGQTVFHSPY